jgi:hypothetical protein
MSRQAVAGGGGGIRPVEAEFPDSNTTCLCGVSRVDECVVWVIIFLNLKLIFIHLATPIGRKE